MYNKHVSAVFVLHKLASVHTYHTGVDLRFACVAMVNDKHLATRGGHKRVVAWAEDAKLGLFGEYGIVFVALEFAERRIGGCVAYRVIMASVMVAGEGEVIGTVVLHHARTLGYDAVLILPRVLFARYKMLRLTDLESLYIELRTVDVVAVV